MRKIAILYEFLSEIGGLERVMVNNYNWLKNKFDVFLGFAYINKETVDNELYNKIKIKRISNFLIKNESLEVIWFCINPIIKRLKIDLAISHSFLSSYYCYRKNIPYIIYLHHPPNFLYPKIEREWINSPKRFIAWLGGRLIVNSNYTKDRIKNIYNKDSIVIYPTKSEAFKILNIKKQDFIYSHGRVI